MENDHDKEVIGGLREIVKEVENELYRPQPQYQDAFFFPDMANITKMQNYIKMAEKSIDLAIFWFTNDVF